MRPPTNMSLQVSMKRVDGDLAVSRSLGDFQYKERDDLPPEQQKVKKHESKERGSSHLGNPPPPPPPPPPGALHRREEQPRTVVAISPPHHSLDRTAPITPEASPNPALARAAHTP